MHAVSPHQPTPPQVLAMIGEAAYGPQWIGALSEHIGVHELSIRRWLTGKLVLHRDRNADGIFNDLVVMLEERQRELKRAHEFLEQWIENS